MSDEHVPDCEGCDDLNPGWQPGDPIAYINPESPAVTVPPYRGDRYEALCLTRSTWPSARGR